MFEGTRILFRNFAGKEGPYNRAGDRNFCIPLTEADAIVMMEEGWNVKNLKSREVGDPDQPYIQVAVSYKNIPPRINLITSKGRTPLTEDMCEVVDWIDIDSVDVIIRPYEWSVSGKSGIKAYLKTMFVIVREDDLERKYADVPILGQGQPALEGGGDYVDAEVLYEGSGKELGS